MTPVALASVSKATDEELSASVSRRIRERLLQAGARMFVDEVFRGRYVPEPGITQFPNIEHLNELMIVGPVIIRSTCPHHLCPLFGRLWIGVMPNEHSSLIGLSKYARLADWIMSRPQIQEEAVARLADQIGQP